jgi:histidine triad (HIT) family protein
MSGTDPCPFCEIAAGRALATVLAQWDDAMVIEPLHPVVPGHVLVLPRVHVADFAESPFVSALTMSRAAGFMASSTHEGMNLITSMGEAATQSVFHLHLHLVPRTVNDGLALPWYSGRTRRHHDRSEWEGRVVPDA